MRHARNPGCHVALLAKAGGYAQGLAVRQLAAPTGALANVFKYRRLSRGTTDGTVLITGILAGSVQHPQAKLDRILAGSICKLIHERLNTPARPARTYASQVAWQECPLGKIVVERAHAVIRDGIPVIGTGNRKAVEFALPINTGAKEARQQ
jgi:hypothetical protein